MEGRASAQGPRFRPLEAPRQAAAAERWQTPETGGSRLQAVLGSIRRQFGEALRSVAAVVADPPLTRQPGTRPVVIRWRDLPADPPRSHIRPEASPEGTETSLTAAAELLAAHPEWEELIPADFREANEALDIIETLQLLPEDRLLACRRYGYEGGLSLNIWGATQTLRTRITETADDDPNNSALRAEHARLLEIAIRLDDALVESRALNGDRFALHVAALRGNIRRRQREIHELIQGLRLPTELTPVHPALLRERTRS